MMFELLFVFESERRMACQQCGSSVEPDLGGKEPGAVAKASAALRTDHRLGLFVFKLQFVFEFERPMECQQCGSSVEPDRGGKESGAVAKASAALWTDHMLGLSCQIRPMVFLNRFGQHPLLKAEGSEGNVGRPSRAGLRWKRAKGCGDGRVRPCLRPQQTKC